MADAMLEIDGRAIRLPHPDKPIFPAAGLRQRDLAEYARRIADTALPHLRERALTIQRFPDGIERDGFFQKRVQPHDPAWLPRVEMPLMEGGTICQPLARSTSDLVYLAAQATVTLHVPASRIDRPQRPDRMIFDLDPPDGEFGRVVQLARALKQLLDVLALPAFVQTTGSRGLHVHVPIQRRYGFDRVRDLARRIAQRLVDRHPEHATLAQRRAKRGGRVYIDVMRNAYGQTTVAPYSLRARPGAPIATPLAWHELARGDLTPDRYHPGNLFRRLARTGDPWRAIQRHAVRIEPALQTRPELDETPD